MTGLFDPGRIGPAAIRNRIVMPPMTTRTADADGFVTADTLAYYAARARGGTGLLTVEMASPERAGRHRHHELGIFDDRFLPGLSRLAAAIRAEGAAASVQLGHGGGHTRRDVCGETPIAPSALPHPVFEITFETIVPEAMTAARIEETTRAFVAAARRAREAGFDCVEIHAAHGYLISQFLTPAENTREDGYGGSLENRARFGLEVLARIRNEVPGIGIVYRLGVEDFFPEGMPFEDGLTVARRAAEGGADAIHVTAGHYRSRPSASIMIPPMGHPDATFLDFAARVRAAVDVPVIAVGRLGDPETARAAVADGKADFVALGRPLLADPDWPDKVREGRPVRRCLACNACIDGMRGGGKIRCLVNPVTGRERAFQGAAGPRGERIAVVGAGPAGLSYAALAADDNAVTVFERGSRGGGAFALAGLAPRFQEVEASPAPFARYVDDLLADCRARGVTFRMRADPLRAPGLLDGFDRIVVATGARPRFGLGPLVRLLLTTGLARRGPLRRLLSRDDVREWFYRRARRGTAGALTRLARPGQTVTVIGDAAAPGKGGEAIRSAFSAALTGDPAADLGPDRISLPHGR